jgi:energy-coupling factor transporter ATP-binding protein EcfA2
VAKASGNVRQYLGVFGFGESHALQLIGQLSRAERMRLCFAAILAEEPHLLLLDESTNHCDYETLDSMSKGLNDNQGAVVMISHNQGFLSGFCKELWVLENGAITINHSHTDSFDELFAGYRTDLQLTGAVVSLSYLHATKIKSIWQNVPSSNAPMPVKILHCCKIEYMLSKYSANRQISY